MSSISPDIVTDGLVLCIDPFSKRCNSSSGGTTLNNLALKGTSASVINGVTSDNIVSLDGVDEYIKVNNSVTSATLSPEVATFSIWFKPQNDLAGSFNASSLISRGNYNTSGGFFIHQYYSSSGACSILPVFSYSTTSSYSFQGASNTTLASGFDEWANVTVSVDDTIKLYINGVLEATGARTVSTIIYGDGDINTNGDTNLIFLSSLSYAPTLDQGAEGYWRPYDGDFGSGMMYNRVLSASEVAQNYNAMKSRFGIT